MEGRRGRRCLLAPPSSHESMHALQPWVSCLSPLPARPSPGTLKEDRHIKKAMLGGGWGGGYVAEVSTEDQGALLHSNLGIARRVRGWTSESWLLPIALGLGLCALYALFYCGSHSTALTHLSAFILFTLQYTGGWQRACSGQDNPIPKLFKATAATRAKPRHVHHGRRLLQTTAFIAAAGGDSHGFLLGVCHGTLAVVVVVACPWTKLEHGQRIALLWDRVIQQQLAKRRVLLFA